MSKSLLGRVWLLDEIRGAAIILMVLYHLGYDLVAIFGLDMPFFYSPALNFLRNIIAGTFIFVSGIACRYSRSNLKRGALTFLFGLLMTAATLLVIPDQVIWFGVLHLLGASMMLYAVLHKPLGKLSPLLGAALFLVLFAVFFSVPQHLINLPFVRLPIPDSLYQTGWLFALGFPSPSFFSSDYYPLLPWFFLFLGGSYIGVPLKAGAAPAYFYRSHARWLAAIGRNTIYIYLIHQPVIYGLLLLLFSSRA